MFVLPLNTENNTNENYHNQIWLKKCISVLTTTFSRGIILIIFSHFISHKHVKRVNYFFFSLSFNRNIRRVWRDDGISTCRCVTRHRKHDNNFSSKNEKLDFFRIFVKDNLLSTAFDLHSVRLLDILYKEQKIRG